MSKKEKIYNKHSFKLLFMCLIAILFFLHTFNALRPFNASEPLPPIQFNVPDQKLPFGNGVAPVKAGLFVKNFLEFNIKQSMFELDGILWFEFDSSIISVENIENFQFSNGFIINKQPLSKRLIGNQILATYDVRVKFFSSLNHKYFPLNDHRIYLILKNENFTPDEIHYEVAVTSLGLSQNAKPFGWRPLQFEVWPGFQINQLDGGTLKKLISYPSIIFALSFAKPGFSSVLLILAPIFILFLFGLLSLLIDDNPSLKLSTTIGSLSGLLVYRFVIEAMAPNVGYFTLTDYLYIIFLTSTFVILITNIYELGNSLHNDIKNGLFYGIQIFALIAYYLLTWF